MNASYDDPKYTSYVLGELDDAERDAVEAELRDDSQLAAAIGEIRATTERLTRALQNEPMPKFAPELWATVLALGAAAEHREQINGAPSVDSPSPQPSPVEGEGEKVGTVDKVAAASRPRRLSWRGRLVAIGSLAIAAGVLAAVLLPGMYGARELARNSSAAVSKDQLQQIGLGLQNYGDKRLKPPPITEFRNSMPNVNNPQPSPVLDAFGPGYATTEPSLPHPNDEFGVDLQLQGRFARGAGPTKQDVASRSVSGAELRFRSSSIPTDRSQPGDAKVAVGKGWDYPGFDDAKQQGQRQQASSAARESRPVITGSSLRRANQTSNSLNEPTEAKYDHLYSVPAIKLPAGKQKEVTDLAIIERPGRRRNLERGRGGFGGGELYWEFDDAHNTEAYDYVNDNPFLGSADNPLSTFSIDVDTASYSNVRRFLMQQNQRPPRGAVRIEELVNYFRYDYPQPEEDKPFSVTTEVASCPWQPEHRLVRIGLKGRELPEGKRPPSNLVFLIDVSGSMQPANKLPLVKQSLKMLAEQLGENDKVSMVVYAGNSGLVLPATRGDHREAILNAIDQLDAGGSTNGAQGIELAYEIATNNLVKGGVNRVILATDGDFNVGITNQDDLVRLIEEKAKTGVFLTTLGFGMGNVKDSTLEKLADKGNGNYAYIDDLAEARKVLVEEIGSTLVTIAKDVKIQVEFNPAEVAGYRLIGYENRILAKEDFNDDKKDAGEIGAGHTVTALYEVVPVKGSGFRVQGSGKESGVRGQESVARDESLAPVPRPEVPEAGPVDALRYQKPASLSEAAKTGELFTLKLRYKQPDGDKSTLMETPVKDAGKKYREASPDFKFAAAVAAFGMILRDSPYAGNATMAAIEELASEGVLKKDDKQQTDGSYRAEFIEMVKKAKLLGAP